MDLITDALTSSFTRIHELPRLKTLELSLYATEDTSYEDSLIIQWTILSAISSQSPSPSLTSLTINRLAPLYHPIYDSPSSGGLLRSLTSLSVLTAYRDIYTAKDHTRNSYVKFWNEAIQDHTLGSLSHNLTTLRLQGQIFVGHIPGPDLYSWARPFTGQFSCARDPLIAKILVLRGDGCRRVHRTPPENPAETVARRLRHRDRKPG